MKITTAIYLTILLLCSFITSLNLKRSTIFKKNDLKSPLQVNRGDKLIIKLAGNATTGHGWKLTKYNDKTLNPIHLESHQFGDYQAFPANGQFGTGGEYVFTFEAKKAGDSALEFQYKRLKGDSVEEIKSKVIIS